MIPSRKQHLWCGNFRDSSTRLPLLKTHDFQHVAKGRFMRDGGGTSCYFRKFIGLRMAKDFLLSSDDLKQVVKWLPEPAIC